MKARVRKDMSLKKEGGTFNGASHLFFALISGYLTIDLRALPALNFGTFLAGICIFLPVAGFTPTLLLRFITVNVPKPVRTTCLFCFNALPTVEINASKQSLQADLGILVILDICSTNFALFIQLPLTVCSNLEQTELVLSGTIFRR